MAFMYQQIHYENIFGLLVRRDGLLHWRCPDCRARGTSKKIRKTCPECDSKKEQPRTVTLTH